MVRWTFGAVVPEAEEKFIGIRDFVLTLSGDRKDFSTSDVHSEVQTAAEELLGSQEASATTGSTWRCVWTLLTAAASAGNSETAAAAAAGDLEDASGASSAPADDSGSIRRGRRDC
ncbi:UNVERIFIED_CONTAM: hypothetical protein PYX00_005982 [Menopon gallinae]|uniref:Uncharacterized protein n=1 Tax=Menopon gallinae TaxID=328185 RepID=A0AAW2HTY3_9NEOP